MCEADLIAIHRPGGDVDNPTVFRQRASQLITERLNILLFTARRIRHARQIARSASPRPARSRAHNYRAHRGSSGAPLIQFESGGGSNNASSAASGAWNMRSHSSKSARRIG